MFKIVIVDDNEITMSLFKSLVGKAGSQDPIGFSGVREALSWCAANEPDLVIVNYRMKELDGLRFLRAFRAIYSRESVPVLMVTESEQASVRVKALRDGANDYLITPIDKLEFSVRARNLLTVRQHAREMQGRNVWLEAEVAKATASILDRERETLHRISRAAEFRDPETGAHIQRMALYSELIAKRLGMSAKDQQLLLDAAPLHDVGKIATPDAILLKPGKLTPDEFEIMKGHARSGFDLLDKSASPVVQAGAQIALTHHEKYDGSGYPQGLAGQDIPLLGRIVAVADVFDALTSERPYKQAWELDRAVAHLRQGAGSHFDPHCVAAFLESWSQVLDIREQLADTPEQSRTIIEPFAASRLATY
ncbi:MAG TPA: HD domain-containing phosphohydrolase [Rhodocyclaceae bacterium]|nr:HD domain-containing phosphohydrolase [Rhodocyclaceae bacterium]